MSSVTRIRSAGRSPAYSGSIQGTALDEQPSYYRALRAASTCVDNIVTALQADALEERAQEIANRATTSERKS